MPKRCELEKITEIERQNSLEPVLKKSFGETASATKHGCRFSGTLFI